MARVTVEDCLKNVSNRFELVLLASRRTRQLIKEGADPLVAPENDKPAIIALREIAENMVNSSTIDGNKPSLRIATDIIDISEISEEIIAETQTTAAEESIQQENIESITEESA